MRKYPWPSLVIGGTRLFLARGKSLELLRATLLRSAEFYRATQPGFTITTKKLKSGIRVWRVH